MLKANVRHFKNVFARLNSSGCFICFKILIIKHLRRTFKVTNQLQIKISKK